MVRRDITQRRQEWQSRIRGGGDGFGLADMLIPMTVIVPVPDSPQASAEMAYQSTHRAVEAMHSFAYAPPSNSRCTVECLA